MSIPAYPEYKESGLEWLGVVPAHWTLRRLDHYFTERREKVSDKDYPALSVTKNGVVPQLETAAKSDDGDNRKLVMAGDFVINGRSDRKGSSGVSTLDGSVSLINIVLAPRGGFGAEFSHQIFRSIPFQEEFYRYGKGIVADLWSTNYSEMKNIVLAVPPESEQSSIASFLKLEVSKIDGLIAEQEKLIALLKEKRQAVISHAVTKGLNPNAPMKDSGIEWLGEVPAHWEVKRLKFALSDVKAGPFGSALTKDMYIADGYRVYGQEQVIPGDFTIGDYFISSERFADLQQYEVLPGDVLVSCVGTFGRIAVVPEDVVPGIINPRLIRLRAVLGVIPEYLCELLRSNVVYEQLSLLSRGGTMDVINIGTLSEIWLPVPPQHEQAEVLRKLAVVSHGFGGLVEQAEKGIDLLKERRSALISAAVTGKIDVRHYKATEAA
jgi:type I restriction enzyme, S subunit